MGAPAQDWFCENGHHVGGCSHHEEMDEPERCDFCDSTNIRCNYEWWDENYGPHPVSHKSIREDEKFVRFTGEDLFIKIDEDGLPGPMLPIYGRFPHKTLLYKRLTTPVYDVRWLFDPFPTEENQLCRDCAEVLDDEAEEIGVDKDIIGTCERCKAQEVSLTSYKKVEHKYAPGCDCNDCEGQRELDSANHERFTNPFGG